MEIARDRYFRTSDRIRDRKRYIFLGIVDISSEIERHNALRMQIGYLKGIEKVLSLSIPVFISFYLFISSRDVTRRFYPTPLLYFT